MGEPFQILVLGDHGDAFLADGEAVGAVQVGVVADREAGGDADVFIDDGATDAGVAADLDAVEQDRIFHQREAIDPRAGRQDGAVDLAAADDRAAQTIESKAAPLRSPALWTNLGGGMGWW